ncbi:hypothetical protein F383_02715 [Gossypium arboreum]|uniref:Uncharacterized protein n=1 Tax=Gossypium arboreum TaxID=29729 RepID=A0A0B0NT27_GOSAR|nr:hypothetical protein F383_02715 [Gossypium arboreum]
MLGRKQPSEGRSSPPFASESKGMVNVAWTWYVGAW